MALGDGHAVVGGISVPRSDGSRHPHVEKKLQRLREREEQSAAQASEHKAAMSVIATVPDPGARRQALRTMSASARVAALLTMPDQEVRQISRAGSRPVLSAAASAPHDSQEAAGEPQEQAESGSDAKPQQADSLRAVLDSKAATPTPETAEKPQDDWIERLRQKHALPSPRVGSAQTKERALARLRGETNAVAPVAASQVVAAGSDTSDLSRMTARAMAAETELQAAKADLASLHKDVEVMLLTMGQVTQVRLVLAPEAQVKRVACSEHLQLFLPILYTSTCHVDSYRSEISAAASLTLQQHFLITPHPVRVAQERDLLKHRVSELEQLRTTAVEAENAQLRVDNAALLQHLEALTKISDAAAPQKPQANYE